MAQADVARAVIDRHGRTFAQELQLDVESGRPAPLYGLLCAALLMSARIDHRIALRTARALLRRWGTARRLAASTWQQRVDVVHEAGYVRYDERTATMLGETADLLVERYRGDLRRLREEAGREPSAERRLLMECKGIGRIGVDIYFREAQAAWEELWPFADRRTLAAAGRLGLPEDPQGLARLAGDRRAFLRLVAGLVRTSLEHDFDGVREAAAAGAGAGARR